MERIDFVIPWVDGGDSAWQQEFSRLGGATRGDASAARYRDWDNLRYWFRGIEKFAPWVGTVHFITWGHLPQWLDTSHTQLNIVRHQDYIPPEYLPTFSSHAIELNMHRIDGLSEKFVYFNDDVFLGRETPPERFFRHGLPCDIARLGIIQPGPGMAFDTNDTRVINRRYHKNCVIWRRPWKWFNRRYPLTDMLKTFSLMAYERFPGMKQTHMAQPYLKQTFNTLWAEEFNILDTTCRNRTRMSGDVNQWLMRMEQIAGGQFAPHSQRDTLLDVVAEATIDRICARIESKRYTMLCLNDTNDIRSFETLRDKLNSSFEKILPQKSRFEK